MKLYLIISLLLCSLNTFSQRFVSVKGNKFYLDGKPYHYIGANYWYGGLIATDEAGRKRITTELDFLKKNGVTNLRVLGGVEGKDSINGMLRVSGSLQPEAGKFDNARLQALDFLLAEMGKRNMKAVIYFSNNWEWSGGFLQYLNWNGLLPDSILKRKLSWDEFKFYGSKFYGCKPCTDLYTQQVDLILKRRNAITGKLYRDDPAIMSWELANEPRPMLPASIDAYYAWVKNTAAMIDKYDKNHLITTGSEASIGSETMTTFKTIHYYKEIDYATIHIWPKNWQWFKDTSIGKDTAAIRKNTISYINLHIPVMKELNKPFVIEEFGLPRDNMSFAPGSSTNYRDWYYELIFKRVLLGIRNIDGIAGCNFWGFGGIGRPSGKHLLWHPGDEVVGDPPVEEQGLNSVFDIDESTWRLIRRYVEELGR